MADKFVCTTQITRMQNFRGPSGTGYVSIRGRPFEVYVKSDVKYFDDNKRFVRFNIKNRVSGKIPDEIPSADEELMEFLQSKAGISEAASKRVTDKFLSKESLIDHVIDGFELEAEGLLTDRQADMVRKAIYDGQEEQ